MKNKRKKEIISEEEAWDMKVEVKKMELWKEEKKEICATDVK